MWWNTYYDRNMHIQLQAQVLTYQFLKKGTATKGNLAKKVTWVLLRNTQYPGGVVAHQGKQNRQNTHWIMLCLSVK
jgi:sporulation-control protein spo0M